LRNLEWRLARPVAAVIESAGEIGLARRHPPSESFTRLALSRGPEEDLALVGAIQPSDGVVGIDTAVAKCVRIELIVQLELVVQIEEALSAVAGILQASAASTGDPGVDHRLTLRARTPLPDICHRAAASASLVDPDARARVHECLDEERFRNDSTILEPTPGERQHDPPASEVAG